MCEVCRCVSGVFAVSISYSKVVVLCVLSLPACLGTRK